MSMRQSMRPNLAESDFVNPGSSTSSRNPGRNIASTQLHRSPPPRKITNVGPKSAVHSCHAHQTESSPPEYSDAYTILAGADHVPIINNLFRLNDPTNEDDVPSHIMRALLWFYIACDVFLREQAKNAVMNQIIERTDRLMDRRIFAVADHFQYVWENTGPESKLRKYALEACAAKASPADLADMTRHPLEFFHELAVLHTRIRDRVPSGLPGLRAAMARPWWR
ncbi:hypothetical protein LTR15_009284 [Elasticomyces elasticus]|nr:hypothetical protein LTR15_009284 [Elasticomyces elasticus]